MYNKVIAKIEDVQSRKLRDYLQKSFSGIVLSRGDKAFWRLIHSSKSTPESGSLSDWAENNAFLKRASIVFPAGAVSKYIS